jgi:hypothetical protein
LLPTSSCSSIFHHFSALSRKSKCPGDLNHFRAAPLGLLDSQTKSHNVREWSGARDNKKPSAECLSAQQRELLNHEEKEKHENVISLRRCPVLLIPFGVVKQFSGRSQTQSVPEPLLKTPPEHTGKSDSQQYLRIIKVNSERERRDARAASTG